MRIVLDTNVLVSGLLSPHGPPGEIVRLVAVGAVRCCHDARILDEYAEVLARPVFGFDGTAVADLLAQVQVGGESVVAAPLRRRLPDPDDEPFLAVAVASGCEYLVTGNTRHVPAAARAGVRVVTPAEFVAVLRREP